VRAERLDAFVASNLTAVSRRRIAAAIRDGRLRVNGHRARPGQAVQAGDRIAGTVERREPRVRPSPLKLRILFEDEHIVVIDKPPGMLVQATRFEGERCVAAALLARYGEVPSLGGPDRAGIVHRLDREVGGVMVCARTETALRGLSKQFRERTIEKEYRAMVEGRVERDEFEIRAPIDLARREWRVKVGKGGKPALTRVRVLKRGVDRTEVAVFPVTGRPHQIRAHLASVGHPIVGDPVYGHPGRLSLQAVRLSLTHPVSGNRMTFRSGLKRR